MSVRTVADDRVARAASGTIAAGALVQIGWGVVETLDPIPDSAGFGLRAAVVVASHLLLLVGVAGLTASGSFGAGPVARTGGAAAALGWGLLAAAQVQVRLGLGDWLFAASEPLIALGMIVVGVAVLRAGGRCGWRRWVPLACGLYPFVVEGPAYALAGGPVAIAFAGWGMCWLALAGAVWTASASRGKRATADRLVSSTRHEHT